MPEYQFSQYRLTTQQDNDGWCANVGGIQTRGLTEADAIFDLANQLANAAELSTSLAHALRVQNDDSGTWSIGQRYRAEELISNARRDARLKTTETK